MRLPVRDGARAMPTQPNEPFRTVQFDKKMEERFPLISLDLNRPIWERFFTVAPLVIIGSRDESGVFDLAPKHMATPLGWQNYFGFVCTPRHRTYQNIQRQGAFTVTFPR